MASDNAMYNKKGYPTTTTYERPLIGDRDLGDKRSRGQVITGKKVEPVSPPSGGGGGGKAPVTDYGGGEGDYLAMLYAERQRAAQDAYDRSKALLDDAYNTASGNYANIYNSGANQLKKAYDNSLGKINANATDAFRQAYVNRMLSERNLQQRLAAMGISGGASETAMTGLLNNYGNARNGIQRTLDSNRNDLEMNYSSNLNDLYNAYQSQMAALDQNRASQLAQLLNNLNNQIAGVQSDYFSMMAKNPEYLRQALGAATANMNNYTAPNTAEATNGLTPVTVYQGNDQGGSLTNYQQWVRDQLSQGIDKDNIIRMLYGQGLSDRDIQLAFA